MNAASPLNLKKDDRRRGMRDVLLATDRLHRTLWRVVAEQLAREDISVVQWLILSDIGSGKERTLTYYARWLARDPGALSRAINELALRGLLSAIRADGDRRCIRLEPTAKGKSLLARIVPYLDQLASTLEQGFDNVPLGDLVRRMTRAEVDIRTRTRTPSRAGTEGQATPS